MALSTNLNRKEISTFFRTEPEDGSIMDTSTNDNNILLTGSDILDKIVQKLLKGVDENEVFPLQTIRKDSVIILHNFAVNPSGIFFPASIGMKGIKLLEFKSYKHFNAFLQLFPLSDSFDNMADSLTYSEDMEDRYRFILNEFFKSDFEVNFDGVDELWGSYEFIVGTLNKFIDSFRAGVVPLLGGGDQNVRQKVRGKISDDMKNDLARIIRYQSSMEMVSSSDTPLMDKLAGYSSAYLLKFDESMISNSNVFSDDMKTKLLDEKNNSVDIQADVDLARVSDMSFTRELKTYYTLLRRFMREQGYNPSKRSQSIKRLSIIEFREGMYDLTQVMYKKSTTFKRYIVVKTGQFKYELDDLRNVKYFSQPTSAGGVFIYDLVEPLNKSKSQLKMDAISDIYVNVPYEIYSYLLKGRAKKIDKYFKSDAEFDNFVILVVYPLMLYFYNSIFQIEENQGVSKSMQDINKEIEKNSNIISVLSDYINTEIKGSRKNIDVPSDKRNKFYKRAMKVIRSSL